MWTDKLAFIGGGNIAQVVLDRLMDLGSLTPPHVFVCDILADRRSFMRHRYRGIHTSEDPREAAEFSKCVVIATPPSAVPEILAQLRPALTPEHVLLSLATSVSLTQLERLAGEAGVVRALVNTPSLVGEGMNLIAFGKRVPPEYRRRIHALIDLLGPKFEVSDEQMDFWCAICSAGPAYIFPVIDALASAARARGIDAAQALVGASQVVLGAARMVQQTGRDPNELEKLTGGLRTLREDEVHRLFAEAYEEALYKMKSAATAMTA